MAKLNKDGQAIGRKGAESRARLLAAASGLMGEGPVEKLTAKAIARAAGLASQTFYLYFDDVEELLLDLSAVVSRDTEEILAELDGPWDVATLRQQAGRFVGAFYRYWDRNRAILNMRNFRADSGRQPFVRVRNDGAIPIVRGIAAHISAAQGGEVSARAALARAMVVYSAIERIASRYAANQFVSELLDYEDLKRAEADILTLLLSPAAPAGP